MYRIMLCQNPKYEYRKKTYNWLDNGASPLEFETLGELDKFVERMLNVDGYSKADFIIVNVLDYDIDAKIDGGITPSPTPTPQGDIVIYNGLDCVTIGKALDAVQGKILNDRLVALENGTQPAIVDVDTVNALIKDYIDKNLNIPASIEVYNGLDSIVIGKALDSTQGKVLKDKIDSVEAKIVDESTIDAKIALANTYTDTKIANIKTIELANDLVTTSAGKALDAAQGKVLDDKCVQLGNRIDNLTLQSGTIEVYDGLDTDVKGKALDATQGKVLKTAIDNISKDIVKENVIDTKIATEIAKINIPIVPTIVNDLSATTAGSTLDATQGKILNDKIDTVEANTKSYTDTEIAKIPKVDIVNDLTSTVAGKALDSTQGKILDDKCTQLGNRIDNLTVQGGTVEVYDALDSTDTTKALSANQGKVLNTKIDGITNRITDNYNAQGNEIPQMSVVKFLNDLNMSLTWTTMRDTFKILKAGPTQNSYEVDDNLKKVIDGDINTSITNLDGRVTALENNPTSGGTVDIVDNLTSTDTDKALSANMGKSLNDSVQAIVDSKSDDIKDTDDTKIATIKTIKDIKDDVLTELINADVIKELLPGTYDYADWMTKFRNGTVEGNITAISDRVTVLEGKNLDTRITTLENSGGLSQDKVDEIVAATVTELNNNNVATTQNITDYLGITGA